MDTEHWTTAKTTKTGNARVIDVDADTHKVLASLEAAHAEVSFNLAKADARVFGDEEGGIGSPDATPRHDQGAPPHARHTPTGTRRAPKVAQEHLRYSTITTTMNVYSLVTPTMQ